MQMQWKFIEIQVHIKNAQQCVKINNRKLMCVFLFRRGRLSHGEDYPYICKEKSFHQATGWRFDANNFKFSYDNASVWPHWPCTTPFLLLPFVWFYDNVFYTYNKKYVICVYMVYFHVDDQWTILVGFFSNIIYKHKIIYIMYVCMEFFHVVDQWVILVIYSSNSFFKYKNNYIMYVYMEFFHVVDDWTILRRLNMGPLYNFLSGFVYVWMIVTFPELQGL